MIILCETRIGYLHLTAVIRYDEAKKDQSRKTDDGLECDGVDGALWVTHTHIYDIIVS